MYIEIMAILAVPAIGLCGFLLGKQSVQSDENKAYRAGLRDGYDDAKASNNVVDFRKVR
ncbi:hypothetical protein [Suicoccus acidiformans]|uniref:hypothetical protein n=1 Tax=Suicoccus acidiformans TaxID=2036206 RepID=UPI0013C32D58|nr:hypothetical protein [Suicoccus acidiformans]